MTRKTFRTEVYCPSYRDIRFMVCPSYRDSTVHILPNISRSKGNQAMKFGQLTEYNMGNIFLEKSYTKCGGETSPRPFSGKLKLSISLDQ